MNTDVVEGLLAAKQSLIDYALGTAFAPAGSVLAKLDFLGLWVDEAAVGVWKFVSWSRFVVNRLYLEPCAKYQ